jgi:hypothetical protein
MQEDPGRAAWIGTIVAYIVHRRFSSNEDMMAWWHGGGAGVRQQFAPLLDKWRAYKPDDTGEIPLWTVETEYNVANHELYSPHKVMTAAGEAYQAIQDLGTAVLPLMVDEFKQGDLEFVDMAYAITGNAPPLPNEIPPTDQGKAKSFLAWWEQNKADWTIPWWVGEATVTRQMTEAERRR